MGYDQQELDTASASQRAAAVDPSPHVRVIAGPGTGKSQTIEQRVCWLIEQGLPAERLVAVSFTRAAAQDLEARIAKACSRAGLDTKVRVGTLHSFALGALRAAGRLEAYPADPTVLQTWEVEHIFDAEFGETTGVGSLPRRRLIRADYEAFCQTGDYTPPQMTPPDPPITPAERESFGSFHGPRTQLYSCVLPGEIIRLCVDQMKAGTLEPADLLKLDHLIVDEFQDLNPMDLELVHGLADAGVSVFAAGDDDQSLYSFRFATPTGIQEFTTLRPNAGDHTLAHCFRCTGRVLDGAQTLIRRNANEGRIEKGLSSMYDKADPSVHGRLDCWRFTDDRTEASAIAESCRRLCAAGMNPRDIMVLLSSRRPARALHEALEEADVPFAPIREADITDSEPGRAAYAMLSIVAESQNYIAHRTLLGIRKGVGIGTCNGIARAVIDKQRNFRDLFYAPIPAGLLNARQATAVRAAASLCAQLQEWDKDETLEARVDDLCDHVVALSGGVASATDDLRDFLDDLPGDMTLGEVRSYLSAGRDDDRRKVLDTYGLRIGEDVDTEELIPDRVRIMTMHSSKGLSARIVFIPALEEDILPGQKRARYPGQVLEAARMLYVSITRARLACFVSYADRRFGFGTMEPAVASRFAAHLGQPFVRATGGLSEDMAAAAVAAAERL